MFTKFTYTWELMGASWSVLKRSRSLLIFPLLSGICCLIVLASFALPMAFTGALRPPSKLDPMSAKIAYYGVLFLIYFCLYFVMSFFNVAIISGAISRMAGGEPTVSGRFREAMKRIHLIFGWALVSATVGLILRMIEERSQRVGRFITGLLGMAWSMISFLVIPILVVEEKGPMEALQESTRLLKKNWGEQLIGNFSFGIVFFVLSIPAYIVGFVAFALAPFAIAVAIVIVAVIYLIGLALIQSALQSIFQAAVYMHTQNVHSEEFSSRTLSQVMYSRD